jgi:hypothetical protein
MVSARARLPYPSVAQITMAAIAILFLCMDLSLLLLIHSGAIISFFRVE